jgi:hypothetical protein
MKSQLLINHRFILIKPKMAGQRNEEKSSDLLGISPFFLGYPINFCFCATDERGLLETDAANQNRPGREDLWAELLVLNKT